MASPTFVSELQHESEAWAAEGLVTPEQAALVRARYGAPEPAGEGTTTSILYATAGVLLGAAALALVFVGFDSPDAPLHLALLGLALEAAGIALFVFVPARRLLADAVLVAGLVPLAAVSFPDGYDALAPLGAAAAAGLLAWRCDRGFVQVLGVVAFSVSAAGASFSLLERQGEMLWTGLQAALLVGLVARDRWIGRDDVAAASISVLALGLSLIPFFGERFQGFDNEAIEVAIGVVALVVMGGGLALRHQGLVLGGATVLGIDAVVFAFDLGGVLTGTIVLVVLAALLVLQAEAIRRFFGR